MMMFNKRLNGKSACGQRAKQTPRAPKAMVVARGNVGSADWKRWHRFRERQPHQATKLEEEVRGELSTHHVIEIPDAAYDIGAAKTISRSITDTDNAATLTVPISSDTVYNSLAPTLLACSLSICAHGDCGFLQVRSSRDASIESAPIGTPLSSCDPINLLEDSIDRIRAPGRSNRRQAAHQLAVDRSSSRRVRKKTPLGNALEPPPDDYLMPPMDRALTAKTFMSPVDDTTRTVDRTRKTKSSRLLMDDTIPTMGRARTAKPSVSDTLQRHRPLTTKLKSQSRGLRHARTAKVIGPNADSGKSDISKSGQNILNESGLYPDQSEQIVDPIKQYDARIFRHAVDALKESNTAEISTASA
jgi:hypothetical protein